MCEMVVLYMAFFIVGMLAGFVGTVVAARKDQPTLGNFFLSQCIGAILILIGVANASWDVSVFVTSGSGSLIAYCLYFLFMSRKST